MRNVFGRAGIEDVTENELLETKSRIVGAVASAATGVLVPSRPCGQLRTLIRARP